MPAQAQITPLVNPTTFKEELTLILDKLFQKIGDRTLSRSSYLWSQCYFQIKTR